MLYREVGAGKKISQLGLGTSQFGSEAWGYGAFYAEHEARLIVRRAVDLGITLFDTAAIYGDGQSERILGEALGEDRASVFLATKAHPILPPSFRLPQRAAASASRLGVARLDLYQMHWPNALAGDGSVMRQMRRLQQDGLLLRQVGHIQQVVRAAVAKFIGFVREFTSLFEDQLVGLQQP